MYEEKERLAVSPAPAERQIRSTTDNERTTVNLTPRSVRALANLVRWTGYTKTDTLNRALQIYEFIQQILRNGGSVHVRQSGAGELERLTFF